MRESRLERVELLPDARAQRLTLFGHGRPIALEPGDLLARDQRQTGNCTAAADASARSVLLNAANCGTVHGKVEEFAT